MTDVKAGKIKEMLRFKKIGTSISTTTAAGPFVDP